MSPHDWKYFHVKAGDDDLKELERRIGLQASQLTLSYSFSELGLMRFHSDVTLLGSHR